MAQPMPFLPTPDETGLTLPAGRTMWFHTPTDAEGRDGDVALGGDGMLRLKSAGAWATSGGGTPFAVGLPTGMSVPVGVVTPTESEDLTNYDTKAQRAGDPTKAALVVLSGAAIFTMLSGVPVGTVGSIYMFPAKPVSDHLGELIQIPSSAVSGSISAVDTTARIDLQINFTTTFVLPAGYWYTVSDEPGQAGNGSISNASAIYYALG